MPRITWIDGAKGLAIALVVFGHVLGGVLARGWVDASWRQVYDFVYLFHMPLFFMVSGFFCIEAMRRSPTHAFLAQVGSIAWPYLLWDVLIRMALVPVIGVFMLQAPTVSWSEWLTRSLLGGQSWFLWTLFVMQVALIPVSRLPVWLLLLVSIAVSCFASLESLGSIAGVLWYLPFLLVGALLSPALQRLTLAGAGWPLLAALAVFLGMGLALAYGWTSYKLVLLVCGIAGSLATIVVVQCLHQPMLATWLARLGMASLAIYVLHPYVQGAAREVLYRLVGTGPAWQVFAVTGIAVGGSLVVWLATERFGLRWLFRLRLGSSRHAVAPA